jgi:hypothetical protein
VPVDFGHLTEDEIKMEKQYLQTLIGFLEAARFYYSYDSDITRSLQIRSSELILQQTMPLWKRVYSKQSQNY